MDIVNPVRHAAKIILFIALFCLFARLIDASQFISLDTANAFALWLHGIANQENYDDLWFFTDVLLSLLAATITCGLLIKLGGKIVRGLSSK